MLHNSFRCAAKENMLQPCTPVRWHHDEIGRNRLCKPANFIERWCATQHIAVCRRYIALVRHFLELFECGLFSVLLVGHERKWGDRRSRRHKVWYVIELTNMREVYCSAQTPSQLPGDLDRLNGHFRKVDWDDDVLNVQRFHAHTMKSPRRAGSALLAKDEAFFALSLARMPPGRHACSECGG